MSGKWKETDWFLCDNYLPYARGGGYVISRSIVDFVGKNAELLRYIYFSIILLYTKYQTYLNSVS